MNKTPTQTWNPEQYAQQARFVSDLGMPVVELLAPKAGERILDLGCGDGVLTEKLAAMGCQTVGVDSSPEFIAAARQRGVDARLADANNLPFHNEFDAVFSNAAMHWMKPPEDVVASVRRALKSGGRFVGEFGGHGNVAAIVAALDEALRKRGINPALVNPWYFPSAEEYGAVLAKHGFTVREIALFPRPTPLPDDVTGWLRTFAQSFIAAVPEQGRQAFLDEVREKLKPILYDSAKTQWGADYVRLRFAATEA